MLRTIILLLFGHLIHVVLAQVPICTIQGAGTASAYIGQVVTTTGIVTAAFEGTGSLQGFFIEDPDCDGLTITSNGIFVYAPAITNVGIGDLMQLTGQVDEYQGCTELKNITAFSVLGSGVVTPTAIAMPLASSSVWERYEGMLVRFPGIMTVTDNDDWAHYGELVMAPDRLWQPTHLVDPNDADPNGSTVGGLGNVAAVSAAEAINALSTIILDDGRTSSWPDPPPLADVDGTVRCGSTVNDLTGVLHYAYSEYRLHPATPVIMQHDPRPAAPSVGGDLRIASWNTHNFWSTLGGFGAANSGEYTRQRTKLVAAMFAMDADALVLCEMQNNDVAWPDLLAALNAQYGSTVYAAVEDDAGFGTKTVIYYKTAVLATATPLDSYYSSTFERAHITQGFEVIANGARFLLSGVHFRSKLCDNATGPDLDIGDGQGCYNAHRIDQAYELAEHWAALRTSTGINAQLIMGDFNSYTQEDPLDMLRSQGLVYLLPDPQVHYSFRYASSFGAIDHALGTPDLVGAMTSVSPWAINADEPPVFDYPDANIAFYQPNAYRSSDHDPVLVGINASELVVGVEMILPGSDIRFIIDNGAQLARWEADRAFSVDVLDMLGRRVMSSSSERTMHSLYFDAIPAGAYIWRCLANGSTFGTGRFVK